MERQPSVYILASRRHGTLYIGVTSDLMGRLWQHRTKAVRGFTSRSGIMRLVRFEMAETMAAVIGREKQRKAWKRERKIALIERENPFWEDKAVQFGIDPSEGHRSTKNPATRVHGS